MNMMNAAVFTGPGRIILDRKPVPVAGPGEAVIKITLTTICGTDVHILKGEYPVKPGLTIGHEPIGTIHELGPGVTGYQIGQRVVVGAITPCGQCHTCLDGRHSQCGGHAIGGWRFGNTIDGCQAEYLKVPFAMANLAPIPDGLTDEQVLMCPDIMSTGFGGAEQGGIRLGDTVAIFAQGPIGLCATAGARLRGASCIIAVDAVPERLKMARQLGADHTIDYRETDPVGEILRLTGGQGVGRGPLHRRLDLVLVHPGDLDGEGDAGVLQHGGARGAARGQDQAFALDGGHQAAPRRRERFSLSRLTMPAAVSSTERRVTSMVGQPRRSKALRALTVSSRTASWST